MFMAGMVGIDKIEKQIIKPLLTEDIINDTNKTLKDITKKILQTASATEIYNFKEVIRYILADNTLLLIDGYNKAISISTAGQNHRAIEQPQMETVIKGPKEAFIESEEINRSLIRKRLRNEKLITEDVTVGERTLTQVSMMYIKDIANPNLVKEVKKRLLEIQSDTVQNLGILEQHIEERPYSLVPTVLYTERPDRAAAFLNEGHVVLIDNSAACLIVPVTFWSFFHTAEDMYERWAYGNFIRIIRVIAFWVALLTPAVYVAVTNFHHETLPADLLLALAATREIVPFPVIIEVLIMEISFELVREGGIRVPTTIGPTIGIVGALILGQAAVEASIVSPILVIVVGITGISSFVIPETSTNFMVRMSRFLFLAFAVSFGFFGISVFLTVYISYLCSIKSFGVSFFSPVVPHYRSSKDTIMRPPIWKQWLRPFNIRPQDVTRKKQPNGRSNQ